MKKVLVFTGILAIFFLTLSVSAFAKSSENKAACEKWCNANKPQCVRCDSGMSCGGRDLDIIKSFKEGSGNWYACGLSEYATETQKNKNDCLAWCRQNEDKGCEFCRDKLGCGAGYNSLKMFGGGGENFYACANRDKLSQMRKQECLSWCRAHIEDQGCTNCSTAVGCGQGFKVLKRFLGEGENWHACQIRAARAECEGFCRGHKPECEFCSANPGCGVGFTSMQTFKGYEDSGLWDDSFIWLIVDSAIQSFKKNWYACKKK